MWTRREFVAMSAAATIPADGRRGEHHVYEFRGSPFAVGRQHGKALQTEIRVEAQQPFERLRDGGARVLARYEGLFREHFPHVIEEIHGMAEGAGLPYPYAFFAATRDSMRTESCTAVAVSGKQTADGRPLLGQTKDTSAPLDRFRIMRIAYESGRRMVMLNYPGWIGNLCLTSDGLSFTGNSLYGDGPRKSSAPASFLKRMVMEKGSTQQVLDAVKGMVFENGCYLIGDRGGHIVCLEAMAGRIAVRDVSGQAFGHANDVLCREIKKYERQNGSASSPLRQASIERILLADAGRISVASLKQAFQNHQDFPLSICRHPSPRDGSTTNASFIADLGALEMHIAIGNPCVAPYVRYELPV
jgi:isopenicillin-N N-acyltransferase-like protein